VPGADVSLIQPVARLDKLVCTPCASNQLRKLRKRIDDGPKCVEAPGAGRCPSESMGRLMRSQTAKFPRG
jgi:hypothetical protein